MSFWMLGWMLFLGTSAPALANLVADPFDRIGFAEGLPNARVLDITQDHHGFIWMATQNGLVRFDGRQSRVFRHDPDDPSSLPDNYVSTVFVDSQDRLWLGTYTHGLARFDAASETFTRWSSNADDPKALCDSRILSIVEGDAGNIWVGSQNGLHQISVATTGDTTVERIELTPGEACGTEVDAVLIDRQRRFWLTTEDGLKRLQDDGVLVNYPGVRDEHSEPVFPSWGIAEDPAGDLWLGSSTGFGRFDPETGAYEHFRVDPDENSESNVIYALHSDSNGALWLGTGGGLFRFHIATGQIDSFVHDPLFDDSLSHDFVFAVHEDREGILWVGTNYGVSRISPLRLAFRHFRHHPTQPLSLPDGTVLALQQEPSGALWVSTSRAGVSRVANDRQSLQNLRHDPADPSSLGHDLVWDLEVDPQGGVWLATENSLDRFEPSTGRFEHIYFPDEAERNTRVLTILWSHSNLLYVGTTDGLHQLDPESGVVERWLDSKPVLALLEGRQGDLWLGLDGGGLIRIAAGSRQPQAFRVSQGKLSHDVISSLHEGPEGEIWIGTLGGGLQQLQPTTEEFRTFRHSDGLPSDSIKGILSDGSFLWLSTDRGLARFDPQSGSSWQFDDQDGGLSSYTSKSYAIGRQGEMFFGGTEGFIAFDPHEVSQLVPPPPPVALTGLSVLNRPVELRRLDERSPLEQALPETDTIVLDHQQYSFRLDFAALQYSNSGNNRYAYQLEGFDPDWLETDSTMPFAVYSNLPAGRYTFRVRAANAAGSWNQEGTSLQVVILPPPWKTWWAYGLYGLIAASILASFVIQQHRKVLVERQVNVQLRRLDGLKDEFLANTSHELRTPLYGMIGLAEASLSHAEIEPTLAANLSAIAASGQRLSHLVDDILDFSKLRDHSLSLEWTTVDLRTSTDIVLRLLGPLVGNKNVTLLNAVRPDLPAAQADENRLQQVLYNLIGNAIKFTSQGEVEVQATQLDDRLHVKVRDTGIGVSEDDLAKIFEPFQQADGSTERHHGGTGLGLSVSRRLVELHGGQLVVESQVGRGSVFGFDLPVAEDHDTVAAKLSKAPPALILPPDQPATAVTAATVDKVSNTVAGAQTASGQGVGSRILVVDDEPINRQVLQQQLASAGYQVLEAEDGHRALELVLDRSDIDLVLLDVMMPGMSGFECCRKIRDKAKMEDLPVIFLTAKTRPVDLLAGLEAGGNDYLAKPVDHSALLARLRLHLQLLSVHRDLDGEVTRRTAELKILNGLLPICAACKKVRDDRGYWDEVESYVSRYSEARFTHGFCPGCAEDFLAEIPQL